MATQDTSKIKNEIIEYLKENGPSLPIQISKHIKMDSLFSSAFLSELFSEQKLKISNMKVGTSPIYYLEETQNQLGKYSEYLNFKEKEAYNLLKQNKFLIDEEQHPAIKVALKSIPDFAKSFQINDKLIWRYFTTPKEDYFPKQIIEETTKEEPKITSEISKENFIKEIDEKTREKPKPKKKTTKTKSNQKKNDKFFNTVKEHLAIKQIEILDIEGYSKDDLTLKIKINNEEKLLIAYNKKRITEDEITKAHKKAKESGLKYIILSFGEPLKRTTTLIEAIKDLDDISKIE